MIYSYKLRGGLNKKHTILKIISGQPMPNNTLLWRLQVFPIELLDSYRIYITRRIILVVGTKI